MNPSKFNSGTLCEKHAKECNLDNPSKQNNASVCSCSNCDSFECFALRNQGHCLCSQGSRSQANNKNITNTFQSKSSVKTVKLPKTDSILKERVKKEITYEYNNYNNIATVKKHSKYYYNCVPEFSNRDGTDDNRLKISTERLEHTRSAIITYSQQNYDTNTAKLSAQIMNVPYKDFKESLSYNKSEVSSPKPTKLSRYDILKRIKEAYKACSCKVCECLIGKPTNRREFCKCKPCECNKCTALIKSINNNGNITQMHIGCPCIRCDRQKECKGIVKKGPQAYCDCDLCDCIKCTDSFTTPCNCQPCECIECRSYSITKPRRNNTLVVASMREDVPRAYCQCSPCDCAECGQAYTMASSLRREMGTGINRPVNCACETCVNQSCEAQDSNSCTCDIQKQLMRKPVEKDTRDYDIHRASVNNKVTERKGKNKNDTIAMFAAVGNSFPKFENINSCSCGDCECIVCSCKQNTTISTKQNPLKYRSLGACKCSPCECVMCDSSIKDIDFMGRKNVCDCNICDCLKCDSLSKPSASNDERHTSSNKFNKIPLNACKCSPCECTDCQKMMYKCTGDSCYCTNCKCQMCTDQTKFINETVYRNGNDFLPLSVTNGHNINNKYFINKNDGKTCLKPKSQQPERECTIHINSRQNLTVNNESFSVEGLNDNPIRKSTQVLIANNSETKEPKRQLTARVCETYAQSNEKKLVQSYRRASEYESSRSFMSENSLLGLASRISNIQPNRNLNSLMEQKNTSKSVLEIEKPYVRTSNNSVSIKFPVKTCSDGYTYIDSDIIKNNIETTEPLTTTTKQLLNSGNYPITDINKYAKEAYPGIIGASANKTRTFSGVEEHSHLINYFDEACSALSRNNETTLQYQETPNVKDLSTNLVTSLKNANERLAILMKPRFSYYHSKLRHSKTDISLPNIKKETISPSNCEVNALFQNSYKKHTEDLSEIEIDFDKLKSTLQQAKAFSIELTKVLKDYEKANKLLESKSVKKESRISNSNTLPDMKCKRTNINELDRCIKSKVNLVECLDRKPYSFAYEPEQKYGSHNLNVMTTKQELSDTDGYQTTIIDKIIQSLPENDSVKVTHDDVDDNINKYISMISRQDIERQVSSKLDQGSILITEPSLSINEHLETLNKSRNHRSEQSHKCRSDKTQKNTKGGKKLRVPRSVIIYKRLQLKEALIKLGNATNTGIRHENLVPQSIQCDDRERFNKADETTQHEHNLTDNKRETTSTSTNAVDRHEISRFGDPVQDVNRHGIKTPSWSILKKNCLINSPYMQNRGVSLMPPLLLDVKDTLRAISRQDGEAGRSEVSNEVTVTGHGNRALLQLQTEVNKLWESSMQQSSKESESKPTSPIVKSKLDLYVKDFKIASSQTCNMICCVERAVDCMDSSFSVAILQIRELLDMATVKPPVVKKSLNDCGNSGGTFAKSEVAVAKINCDTLKVKFLGLRRVSDHTVLVKWKAPQDMTSVQGYELLVDGRAVQKILSPTRCMAVVTCLPHIEKVLITIRTLVSAAVQRAHYPSATIVYRTHAK